jgi:hypothetical protein
LRLPANCATTTGEARSVQRKLGTNLAWGFGEGKEFSVYYLSPTKRELVIDIITSSFYTHPSYEGNQGVEVVYDKDSPGRAPNGKPTSANYGLQALVWLWRLLCGLLAKPSTCLKPVLMQIYPTTLHPDALMAHHS